MITFVKFFFTSFCSFYLFKKILKIENCAPWNWFDYFTSIILAGLMVCAWRYIRAGSIFVSVAMFCVVCSLHYQQAIKVSVVAGIVAFGLSYIAMSVASLLLFALVFLAAWIPVSREHIEQLGYIVAGLLQCLIVTIPFRSGRLVNGMPYLRDGRAGWFGAVISLHLLLATSLLSAHPGKDVRILFYIILAAESGIVLVVWWYNKILRRYFEKIKNSKLEHLHTEVQQLQDDRSEILSDNLKLAKIVHADSKAVPAMGAMLKEIIDTAEFPNQEYREKAIDLLDYVDSSMQERAGTFFAYHDMGRKLPQTGVSGVDAMIRHMASRAYAQCINFEFICAASVKHLVHEHISAGDLSKIIGDLIENAIIAEKDSEIKEILLSIRIHDAHYVLDIADTGSAFAPAVIEKLGTEPITTHGNTGGSGLGLLSILEITGRSHASFLLDDSLKEPPFSKRLSICFDGLGQIRIKTERSELLRVKDVRPDIIWFS